ncbi:MAG: molybdate ABC transporter substrate-binding protein [Aquabacterium sp.]|nr:molybdate ABC transporter substrate-binding protein [Aquabacterium sp.]
MARADQVNVAVAANFAVPFQRIAADFALDTGHTAVPIVGSTRKFYAQIKAGAPFEVMLAADGSTPRQLEDEGWVVKGSRFTYAKGKLVLWSAKVGFVDSQGDVLRHGVFARLALGDPKLAPYGAAAVEALRALGLYERLASKIVQGESIAQAQQFAATGNAELAFLAQSQVVQPDKPSAGSWWLVPETLYKPIVQDAALLKKGQANVAAIALLRYLRSDKAKAVIKSYGYSL